MGSLINIPYTSWQSFRKDTSRDLTPYIYVSRRSDALIFENGSLREITLLPLSTKKYAVIPSLDENISIIQIDIWTTGPLIFKIARLSYDFPYPVRSVFWNQTMHSGWFEERLSRSSPITYFWTPPLAPGMMPGFIFENPSDREIFFSFKVTEHLLKATERKEITHYRTLLNTHFAYVGILLIGTAFTLDAYFFKKGKHPK